MKTIEIDIPNARNCVKPEMYMTKVLDLVNLCGMVYNAIGNKDYDILNKNCKSFARTILYFCKKHNTEKDVLESMLGLFTDKPFHIPHPE